MILHPVGMHNPTGRTIHRGCFFGSNCLRAICVLQNGGAKEVGESANIAACFTSSIILRELLQEAQHPIQ